MTSGMRVDQYHSPTLPLQQPSTRSEKLCFENVHTFRRVSTVLSKWLPATLHGGDGLPGVPSDVQTLAARHAHGPVVSAHAVQHVVQRGHGAAAPPAAHGRHGHPLAHSGVVPLHGGLVVSRVEASQSVQAVVYITYT